VKDAGLCASCRHARTVSNRRGSVFLLCRLAGRQAGFPRYPMLPVLRCSGHETATATTHGQSMKEEP
jgi:hypothetical protein